MTHNEKNIAILFHADLDNRKGMTNAILNRISHLRKWLPSDMTCSQICTAYYDSVIIRALRKKAKKQKDAYRTIDGIKLKIVWRLFTLTDYILKFKLRIQPFFATRQVKHISRSLKNYDLISAHSLLGGEIAFETFQKYHIPYCITWHGTDIHTMPYDSPNLFEQIKNIIENASMNFFVSADLLNKSHRITTNGKKTVLYNGCSPIFSKFSQEERNKLRSGYINDPKTKIVAFVGNLIPVKNADLLPEIFARISRLSNMKIEFWIIGDGDLRGQIERTISDINLTNKIRLFGNVEYAEMPRLMNCIDLLILPSRNEGLPLVTVEAIHCGAMVIGSDAGGISEAIGVDNTVPTGENFVEQFAQRCVDALDGKYIVNVNDQLDWDMTAHKEIKVYQDILG